jgi:two-component system nitrogen regulation response regulator GlnG
MVGRSPAMQSVYKQIAFAAAAEAPVLLCGESGTGKELAARAIHRYSARGAGPFVAVNVAALNAAIAESELFGHVRGAFTGAEEARSGLLAMADGGTLFLDEVADIPLPTQVKLLRALERGEMLPVGGNEPIRSNFRVISATHRNLLRQVDAGAFRHDLYFRLCAFQVELPPLRTRTDDIPELAHHFVRALSKSTRPGFGISTEALQELSTRPWRGNVRELRNAIDHALIVARGKVIVPDDLPQSTSIATPVEGEDRDEGLVTAVRRWAEHIVDSKEQSGAIYDRLLEVVEPPLFAEAMKRNKAQFATAARALGIHRTTLRKKLADHGLDSPQDGD